MKYLIILLIGILGTLTFDYFRIKIIKTKLSDSGKNKLLYTILMLSFDKETISKSSNKIIKALNKSYGVEYCTIFQYTPNGLEIIASNIESDYLDQVQEYSNNVFNELKNNHAQIRSSKPNKVLNYPTARVRKIQYSYFIPLKNKEIILGALLIENKNVKSIGKIEEEFLEMVTNHITVTFQSLIYYDKLVLETTLDGLTLIYNKKNLLNKIKSEFELHVGLSIPFSLVMIDLDNFKVVNDTYGHQFGDTVLKAVAKLLKNELSNEDFVGRYGGEEFTIFFNSSGESLYSKVEDIREKLSKLVVSDDSGTQISITGSFGIAEFPRDGENIDEILEAADQASYFCKKSGKNKVSVYNKIKGEREDNK